MPLPRPGIDPFGNDPDRWGTSMAQLAELLIGCLEASGARSVVEVGAFAGDLTRVLSDWAVTRGARVTAIDPAPRPALTALADERPALELIRRTSLEALPEIPLPDALIVDGDHNYFTVAEELRIVGERAPGPELPLLLLHDVCWPHGRRDDYFDADLIPAEFRHPVAGEAGGIMPGEPGLHPRGLPYPRSASREGGARNGVLGAVEDFVAARDDLRLVVVPAFFGLGVVWHGAKPWADELAAILDPWDRNPLLERLEGNRLHHLAQGHARLVELWGLRERQARQEALLRRMLESSAFGVAERLSHLRMRAGVATNRSVVSRHEIRRALGE